HNIYGHQQMGSALHIVKEGGGAAGRFLKLLFWVKDEEAEKAAWLREAEETKKRLLQLATDKIAPLQDAVDLEEATDEEKARLNAWKKYRVLVNRVDTSKPEWPEAPSA
ncbi:tail fiber assembly protein, partial [Salmonella enterica]